MKSSQTFTIRTKGELAIFSRPEFKGERFSYPVITPSAARGLVEAVLWKPAIAWRIHQIQVLSPIRWKSFLRNEVKSKAVAPASTVVAKGGRPPRLLAEDDRAQRNTVALRDVDYLLDVSFVMTPRAGEGDSVRKFEEMFLRRLEKGQAFHQPYFGCRECIAEVGLPKMFGENTPSPISKDDDFGITLWDIEYDSNGGRNTPVFYHAKMNQGTIEVPLTADEARNSLVSNLT